MHYPNSIIVSLSEGLDFNLTLEARTVTFFPGDATLDFSLPVYRDGVYEAVERLSLTLQAQDGETAVQAVGGAQVLIVDSDSKWTTARH